MEDAVEQLDQLARSVGACTKCEKLVACRLRAVPGAGHPHCAVMVVSLHPDPADEQGDDPAGAATLEGLAEFMPALRESRDKVYATTLTTGQGNRRRFTQMQHAQLLQQIHQSLFNVCFTQRLVFVVALQFKHRTHVVFDIEFAKYRRFLRQVAQA